MQAQLEKQVRGTGTKMDAVPEGPQRRLLRGYLHKTSNGLCGIKGYASMIAATDGRDPGSARWARKIIAEVERMEQIFRSVGDLSRPAGLRRGADLGPVLEEALRRARRDHPGLEVEVGRVPEASLLLPAADLGLVLDELLANSAQARPLDGPAVRVRIDGLVGLGDRIALIVQDDGPGIDRDLLPQAADPFVTTREGRLGIGLTRIETLLDMYGLAWNLASAPGRGVAVTLEVGESESRDEEAETWKRKAAHG